MQGLTPDVLKDDMFGSQKQFPLKLARKYESLNQGTLEAVKEASIVNAQSSFDCKLKEPIAEAVIEKQRS